MYHMRKASVRDLAELGPIHSSRSTDNEKGRRRLVAWVFAVIAS